jgi:DNA-binding transcriptional regulator YhcF (GntR family)
MNNGWIKLHRGLLDHWIFTDPKKFKWWITILLRVNHEPKKLILGNNLVEVGSGESIRSLRSWAMEFNTTAKTVKSFFDLLQNDGMIETKSIGISTHLKICNWVSYQDSVNTKETRSKRKVNTEETASKHELPTNKNEKNEKNEKNIINIPSQKEFEDYVFSVDATISREAVQLKYKAWVENGWKDGNNRPIKNWKSKILNTMAYMPKKTNNLQHLNQAAKHDSDKF